MVSKECFMVSAAKHLELVWVQRWPVDWRMRKMVPGPCLKILFWYLPAAFFNVLAKVHSQHSDYCKSDLSNESGSGWFYFCSSRLLNTWLDMWSGQWVSIEYDTFFLWTILNFMIFIMIFEQFWHGNVYFCCLKSALAEIYMWLTSTKGMII